MENQIVASGLENQVIAWGLRSQVIASGMKMGMPELDPIDKDPTLLFHGTDRQMKLESDLLYRILLRK